jgi:hypothetical protein
MLDLMSQGKLVVGLKSKSGLAVHTSGGSDTEIAWWKRRSVARLGCGVSFYAIWVTVICQSCIYQATNEKTTPMKANTIPT